MDQKKLRWTDHPHVCGENVNRQQMVAQLTHGLMEALGKAITSDQPAAVVGCARELNNLLGLSAIPTNVRHH